MKNNLLLLTITLLFFGFSACQKDSANTQQNESKQEALNVNGEDCFNFRINDSEVPLGCACLPAPLNCTPDAALLCNFGAILFPITIGDYKGFMASIGTGLVQAGNGALQLSLIHYFVTEDGNHSFWTEDQAVCAPAGNNPATCQVNDVLDITGGCGDFEGISGKLHSHGTITFDGGAELCSIFYLGGGQDYVPTGTINFDFHGRICVPGAENN